MKHINIPVFVQHMGCPNQCVFCDQHAISGIHSFNFDAMTDDIEKVLKTVGDSECEIAFFGGSFTGIDRTLMIKLLDIAENYVKDGRVKGIRMSTRPDYISEEIIRILHKYTISQVELGIQSFSDDVLKKCRRGHTAEDTYNALSLLRREGFSFVGQMMTGLPGATVESEIETARIICSEGADGARIYPLIVFKNTPLAAMTGKGEYIPLTLEDAVERSAAAYKVFILNNVPCLKIGLHESENLHSPKTYYAGPNHPAIGEMIRGKIYFDMICEKLNNEESKGKTVYIFVPKGTASAVSGQHKMYKSRILEKTSAKCVKILEIDEEKEYNISIKVE